MGKCLSKGVFLFLAVVLLVREVKAESNVSKEVVSPNNNLRVELDIGEIVTYSLKYKEKVVVKESKLGFEILQQYMTQNTVIMDGFSIRESKVDSFKERWKPIWGEELEIENSYNEIIVSLEHKSTKILIDLIFRVFNDGIGFRYSFPKQEALEYFKVVSENTEFNLAEDMNSFWIPGDYNTNENSYTKSKLSEIPRIQRATNEKIAEQTPVKNAVHSPLMLKRDDGVYINIHEAALIDYSGMCLKVDSAKFILTTELTPDYQGFRGNLQTPCQTPWRTIIVSDKATDILASRTILNLNEPSKYKDTEWIKPMKYIGVWWEMFLPNGGTWAYSSEDNVRAGVTDFSSLPKTGNHSANNENVKMYLDFAGKHGFDGVLVEGWNQGWENGKFDYVSPYPDFDMKMLSEYAKSKGVALIMHHETAGNSSMYERQMDEAFRLMNKYGYPAVKTGYVGGAIFPRGENHYGQTMVNHYLYNIKKAEQYKIAINAHEPVHPTGLHRTYPNFLACESARGTEFEAFGGNKLDHLTIMPFTRFMGGPMDYTPGIFEIEFKNYKADDSRVIATTIARQLALYVTVYSPFQMAADKPSNYEKFLDAFQFIKDVPVDWAKTLYLSAEPGDYISIARKDKNSSNWFVGAITDENRRELEIDFSFLDANKKYEATIYQDKKGADYKATPKSYEIIKKEITSKTKIKQFLAPNGGVAISVREL